MLRIWNDHYTLLTTSNKKHTLSSLQLWYRERAEGHHEYYGLFEEGTMKAFMIVKCEENTLWIKMLAVEKTEIGKGYGTALLDFAIKELSSSHMSIFSEVKAENTSALKFFQKREFEIQAFDSNTAEYTLRYAHPLTKHHD